jgi:hypothetical protein
LFENYTITKEKFRKLESLGENLLERLTNLIMKDQKLPIFLKASPDIDVSSVENKNKQFEDLPDEVILTVLNFLQLQDLIRCGLVSKRIRSVSFIESLWQKIDIVNSGQSWKIVKTDLVKRIINRGCKSLSLRGCKVKGNLKYSDFNLDLNYWNYRLFKFSSTHDRILSNYTNSELRTQKSRSSSSEYMSKYIKSRYSDLVKQMGPSKLISLNLTNCDVQEQVLTVLLTACHSLKKLTLTKVLLTTFMCQILCNQNGQTLQSLDLNGTNGIGINQYFLPKDILLIVKNCVSLIEVDFSGCQLFGKGMELLVKNLSPNVEKLALTSNYTTDEHIIALVSRCKRLTSLNLAYTDMLTDNSLTSITENLKLTLEELYISCRVGQNITFPKFLDLRSMPKLKALNYCTINCTNNMGAHYREMPQEVYEELKKTLPQLNIMK